jgi:putative ABC transport system permease protein
MFRNYFKTALRNLLRNKFYTSINIIGLAVGLATCLLIILFVMDELSYDRYNLKADRIYRINNDIKFGGNHVDLSVAAAPMGPAMVKEFPEVEQYCRLVERGSFLVKKGRDNLRETKTVFADSTLFDLFTLPMIAGYPRTALIAPRSLVITESIAKKYFNRTDVVGQNLIIDDSLNYKITGVIRDLPRQSHFNYDFFLPMTENADSREENWLSENYTTYILLRKERPVPPSNQELDKMANRHIEPQLQSLVHQGLDEFNKSGNFIRNTVTPLTDIHLHSNKIGELGPNGSAQFVYIFSVIALFILVIACVNFMNLSTARSANRAKEVGVRKVLGSLQKNLVGQFLTESTLITLFSLLIALGIAWLMLPYFNDIAGKEMYIRSFFQPSILLAVLLLVPLVSLLAGAYPAFFLSAFQPIDVLKGKLSRGFKGSYLRNILVVFQFAISIVLIVGTMVIYNQLHFIRNKDLGFDRDQVMIVQGTDALNTKADAFKNALKQMPGVESLTTTGYLPVDGYRSQDAFFTSPALDQKTAISMQRWTVDDQYVPTLGLQIVQGRNFSRQFPTDSGAILINEAAARYLGEQSVLHKRIFEITTIKPSLIVKGKEIIGVVKNFNFKSLRDVITPLSMQLGTQMGSMAIRTRSTNLPHLLSQIHNTWQAMVPGQPFDYVFMNDQFNDQYKTEQRTGQLFISFAVLGIFIACLGLFGLAAFAAEQRTREIGIRKVLGASVSNIASLLTKDFFKLVIISALIAFPLSWWAMNKWLQDFAYRIQIGWWIFFVAGMGAMLVALLTVSFQAIKAAVANPVESLRTE